MPAASFARSFGSRAESYDRMRPPYPEQAVDFVLAGRPPGRVLDLGAGTGKLTRTLLGRAAEVIAVEPDDQMRAVLAATVLAATDLPAGPPTAGPLQAELPTAGLPRVEVLAGSAERLPLPDASVDAVFAGQAFHWFARPATDLELARVLRPGGVVGLIWNLPDQTVPWVPELYRAIRQPEPPWSANYADLDIALFTPAESHWTSWRYQLPGLDGLLELVHTWSWVITRPPAEQRAIDQRVRILATRHAELQGGLIEFPHRTKAVRQYLR
jgi:SAM-dependent methyltransferase